MFQFKDVRHGYKISFHSSEHTRERNDIYIDVERYLIVNPGITATYYGPYSNADQILSDEAKKFCDRLLRLKAFW